MNDSMKDWPVALRLNAAICALAEEMYIRYCEAYSQPILDWKKAVSPSTRGVFLQWADTFLHYAKSQTDQVTKERQAMDKLIADCYPISDAPADALPVQSSRFETLAADLAREAFYVVPKPSAEAERIAPVDIRD